jgi:YrbI family 3-deoxy-D-manno-octulosonate 8-phosphate phosphatase
MLHFPANLRHLFAQSPDAMQRLADQAGVTPASLGSWAEGSSEPGLAALQAMAAALQMSVDRLIGFPLASRHKSEGIRMLVLDIDGVMTDGGIYLTENGDEFKKYNAHDGRGILTAQKMGIEVAFLSGGRHAESIRERARRLGVHRVYVGTQPKTEVLASWLADAGLQHAQVAYIGDDANDLDVIAQVGFSACPSDAMPKNKGAVDVILRLPGGQGCVREFIEEQLGIEVD